MDMAGGASSSFTSIIDRLLFNFELCLGVPNEGPPNREFGGEKDILREVVDLYVSF